MAAHSLSRWQKAGALVPMTVLVVAWGAAIGNSGLATADDRLAADQIPDVPATAFDEPASVQESPAGIDDRAGADGTVATLSTNGIPASALAAYRRAETLLAQADASCNLPWNLVAAIGRVESNHGRVNGNALDADGVAQPGIYGIALDGRDGVARIMDTDGGALDNDSVYDRAVGPMQFIPGTWSSVGVDADNDGTKNPQDIDDAAAAAGIYLCAGAGDLSTAADAAEAVKRYNRSDSYVDLVLRISSAYGAGDFSPAPNGTSTATVLTSRSLDQTLTPAQRADAKESAAKPAAGKGDKPTSGSGSDGGSTSGGTGGGSGSGDGTGTGGSGTGGGTGGTGGSTGGTGGSGGSTPPKTVGGAVQGLVDSTPLAPITKPVTDLLSVAEANIVCLLTYPLGIPKDKFDACVLDKTT